MRRVTEPSELKAGDVVLVTTMYHVKGKASTVKPWRRFACVTEVPQGVVSPFVEIMYLRMQVSDNDFTIIPLGDPKVDVMLLDEAEWPEGVVGMRVKHIHLGNLKPV